MSGLTEFSKVYKPFQYPWAMEYAEQHEKIHWGSWEAKLQEDVAQWKNKVITDKERAHITQILRIFTQSDVAVGGNYCDIFIPHFKNNEIGICYLALLIEKAHINALMLCLTIR